MAVLNIYLSFSHQDEKYKNMLLNHLKSLELQGIAFFFDSSLIHKGGIWSKEIERTIENSKIVILLISQYFLAEEFIIRNELPIFFRKANTQDTLVFSILINPCSWTSISELAKFQFLNDVRNPISTSQNQEEEFALIAKTISDLAVATNEKQDLIPIISSNIQTVDLAQLNQQQSSFNVFISHSKIDSDFAELMKLRLEKEGISSWIDNDRLEPGVDWRNEIDVAIKNARIFIAIMSPEARESEYVTYEWAYAMGCGIRIVPIMLRETSLHPKLGTLQYIDFTNFRVRPWERLIACIGKNKSTIKIVKKD